MTRPAWLSAALDLAKPLMRRFEGFRSRPYLCPAGVATIAFGATRYPDGRKVTLKDKAVSREEGEAILDHDAGVFLQAAAAISPVLRSSPERLAAIGDFCFNLGTTRYKGSTLRRKVDAEAWDEAAEQLLKWVFGGGRKLPGLVLRRQAEVELLKRALQAANDDAPLSADERAQLVALLIRLKAGSDDPIGELLQFLEARAA